MDATSGANALIVNDSCFRGSQLTISIPKDREEQTAIATILTDMDKEIADLEAKRDKYSLLKSGMMQKLLTGQIRLKINRI